MLGRKQPIISDIGVV